MAERKDELAALVSENNVLDDTKSLDSYSKDESFACQIKPGFVVKPHNSDEVQRIIAWANRTNTPLIPVSSGPPHFHGDTVPNVPRAVVVDLGGMKKIISINRRNRMVVVEPGVTYGELQQTLAQNGMRLSNPLLPRANKSVITSLLEREPRMNCRYQWSSMDPLRSLEIIWGDGNRLWTGGAGFDSMDLEKQWKHEKWQVEATGPGQTDFYRLLAGSQGSMGIATWASLRCEVLPQVHRLFFVSADRLDDLIDFTYQVLKFRYADELFLLNRANLAHILGQNTAQIIALKEKLPPWIILVGIAGRTELPEERVEFQEKDIRDIASQFSLELVTEIAGFIGSEVLDIITKPSRKAYWKLGYKGGCQDIFFISTLDRTPDFVKSMFTTAESAGYPTSDIGVYLQPRHQGVNCHIEFILPYAPESSGEVSRVRKLFKQASQELFNLGAFFTRPYGEWADFAFKKDPQSTKMLKMVKGIFDPSGVMNPGKLCFEVKKAEVE
jgi:FAD/FMN-containing dehydrogenase